MLSEAKTMDRMVVEVAVNAARVEGMEAMREACMQVCEDYADRCSQHNEYEITLSQAAYALTENIRALKVEEVLK